MLDINSGEQIEALYRMVKIKGGNKEIKFQTTDINRALKFHKWRFCLKKQSITGKKKR